VTDEIEIRFVRTEAGRDLPAPTRATEQSAGFDLRACIESRLDLAPGERALVPSGISIALPPGFEAQVRPRSGLAVRLGLTMLNAPGTIDSDYRGEIRVVLVNHGQAVVRIGRGDRIAQLVVQRLPAVRFAETDELPPTARGTGGFGHTGER
jgi:dUTP pyrophosphatase